MRGGVARQKSKFKEQQAEEVDKDFNNFMRQIDNDGAFSGENQHGSEEGNGSRAIEAENILALNDDSDSDGEPYNVQAEVNKLMGRLKATIPVPPHRIEDYPSQRQRHLRNRQYGGNAQNSRVPRLNRVFKSDRFYKYDNRLDQAQKHPEFLSLSSMGVIKKQRSESRGRLRPSMMTMQHQDTGNADFNFMPAFDVSKAMKAPRTTYNTIQKQPSITQNTKHELQRNSTVAES